MSVKLTTKQVEKVVVVDEKVITIELNEKQAYALHALLGAQALDDWISAIKETYNIKTREIWKDVSLTSVREMELIWDDLNKILIK